MLNVEQYRYYGCGTLAQYPFTWEHSPYTQYCMAVSIRCECQRYGSGAGGALRQSQLTAHTHQFFLQFSFFFFNFHFWLLVREQWCLVCFVFFFLQRFFRHSLDSFFASSPLEPGLVPDSDSAVLFKLRNIYSVSWRHCAMRFCIQIISVSFLYARVLVLFLFFFLPIFFSQKWDFHYSFQHTNIAWLGRQCARYTSLQHACMQFCNFAVE